jgi:hypothetical protein
MPKRRGEETGEKMEARHALGERRRGGALRSAGRAHGRQRRATAAPRYRAKKRQGRHALWGSGAAWATTGQLLWTGPKE